jgi:hypothetical protein
MRNLWGAAFSPLALALFVVKMLQYGPHGWLDWFALVALALSAVWSVLAIRRKV